MNKDDKTNVCRILDQKKIEYNFRRIDTDETNGIKLAELLGQDPNQVFKTLVTVGTSKTNYVFIIPVCKELNLKVAAKIACEKKIEMIPQKELLPLTGYIHGGCSPIGMKKQFKTFLNSSATNFETIFFSAGKIGAQVEVDPSIICNAFNFSFAELI